MIALQLRKTKQQGSEAGGEVARDKSRRGLHEIQERVRDIKPPSNTVRMLPTLPRSRSLSRASAAKKTKNESPVPSKVSRVMIEEDRGIGLSYGLRTKRIRSRILLESGL